MGKTSGDQKVTTTTKLPSWYTDTAMTAMDQAKAAAANIAQPYKGNTVAGLDPITQKAIAAMGDNIGSTNPAFQQAIARSAGVAGYTPQNFLSGNISNYMNPYIQNVEKSALSNMDRAYKQNLNTIGDGAVNAKAFGGSRQGIAEGVAAAENSRQMGDLSGQLRSQGYGQAASMMQSDMDRALQGQQLNLSAANQMGALAGQGQQAYLQSLQAAMQGGDVNRGYNQQLLDQEVNRYDAMSNIPANQLNLLLAALSGTQVPTSSTQKTPTSGNWLTGAAGGAMAGFGGFGLPGALFGGLLGGIAGS